MKKAIAREKSLNVSSFGVSLAVIFFMLLFAGVGVAGATVSYNATEDLIHLINGTNTLASMYSDISNASVLNYTAATNTYTLYANTTQDVYDVAHLTLADATLKMNGSRQVYCRQNLTINNMTILSDNAAYTWEVCNSHDVYNVSILDSDFSGGRIKIRATAYREPITPIYIANNYFHDYTSSEGNEGVLQLTYNAPTNATLYNNTFEDITLTGGQYNGIIVFTGHNNLTIDGLYIRSCSVISYGMTYFYGPVSPPATIKNFEITDCIGDGIAGKEYGNIIIENGTITNVSGDGVHFYSATPEHWIHNVTMDGIGDDAFSGAGYGDNYYVDIYNVAVNDTYDVFKIFPVDCWNMTNFKATNYTRLWDPIVKHGELRFYELADISVIDGNSSGVEGATITIEAINPDVSDCVINRNLEVLNLTITLSNGHTPLPDEDKVKTIALLRHRKTTTTDKTYSYNITASKDGKTATMSSLDIDETWYREDPDKPTKTVVCNIDTGECWVEEATVTTGIISGTVTDTNGTTIVNAAVTDGTRVATTDENGEYTISNVPEGDYTVTASANSYNASSVDNVTVTADETITVNFTLTPSVTTPPTTSYGITPPPTETGWNTVSPVVVTFFRSSNNSSSGIKYTNYSKVSAEEGPWTTVNVTTATGTDAENVTDITEATFNVTVSDEGVTTIWYYSVDNNATNETVKNVTVKIDTTPHTDLVSLWHFDEGTGTIAMDSSGNGNNGTFDSPAWVDGIIGKALRFDGTEDYIEIPSSASLDSINSQITVVAWIKTDFAQRGTIVDNWFYDKTVEPPIGERAYVCTALSGSDAGKFDFGLSPRGNGSGSVWLTSNTAVTSAQWTHVAFVSDGSAMSIYLNGELDASTSAPAQIYSSNRPIHIGAWNAKEVGYPSFDTFFNGTIDEVKIYNKALSSAEIQADYEAAGSEDTTPPSTISNLQNVAGTTWINWTWTNPPDEDFSHTMVYLDGIWKTNTSDAHYNATGLSADTSYELSTLTVDTNGNVNTTTWVNQTATTLAVPNSAPDTPGNPYPSTHAPDLSIVNTDLSWSGGDPDDGDTVTYDVYFGTVTSPPLVSTDQTGTIYDPGTLSYDTTYYWQIVATDNHGLSTSGPLWDFTTGSAPNGALTGTITSTNDGTGVSDVTVNLTLNSTGTVVASTTTTDSSGDYLIIDQAPGEYTLTVSKIRFWSDDSTSVTVNAGASTITNCALWRKGDLNNNGISADAGDRAMMKDASVGKLTADWRYDLNTNGLFADAGDQAMMKDASVGKIELL